MGKNARKSVFFLKKELPIFLKIFLHISSRYAKILGDKNIHTREIPRSGSKAKDGEKRGEKRLNDGNNNGQLRIATPPQVAHAKQPGPKLCCQ